MAWACVTFKFIDDTLQCAVIFWWVICFVCVTVTIIVCFDVYRGNELIVMVTFHATTQSSMNGFCQLCNQLCQCCLKGTWRLLLREAVAAKSVFVLTVLFDNQWKIFWTDHCHMVAIAEKCCSNLDDMHPDRVNKRIYFCLPAMTDGLGRSPMNNSFISFNDQLPAGNADIKMVVIAGKMV